MKNANLGIRWRPLVAQLLVATASLAVAQSSGTVTEVVDIITPQSIVAGIICIGIGLFLTFFGYRFFRPMLFFAGFALFALIAYIGAINISPLAPGDTLKETIYLVVIVIVGFIGGILVAIFWRIGLFVLGAVGGFFLAMFILALAPNGLIPNPLFRALFIVILVIICAVLVFKLERPAIIIATSVAGAFLTILGIDFFVHTQFLASMVAFLSSTGTYTADGRTYGMLAGVALLALLGMIIQFRFHKGFFRRDKSAANTSNRADNV